MKTPRLQDPSNREFILSNIWINLARFTELFLYVTEVTLSIDECYMFAYIFSLSNSTIITKTANAYICGYGCGNYYLYIRVQC